MKCYYEMRYTLNYISLKNMTSYYKMIFLERYVYLCYVYLFYLGFYVAFNTVQVISRRVVGRAEETST